jgi:acyl carrier protein
MPNRETIRAQIKGILVKVLQLDMPPEQIRDNDALFSHGMGVDSVEAAEILKAIEDRFEVHIPEDLVGLALFEDVSSLAEAVETELAKRPA